MTSTSYSPPIILRNIFNGKAVCQLHEICNQERALLNLLSAVHTREQHIEKDLEITRLELKIAQMENIILKMPNGSL
jgi:hypothetical protein